MKVPSGFELGLHNFLVPEELGKDFFSCPKGHFWYKKFEEPPAGGYWEGNGPFKYAHAKVPITFKGDDAFWEIVQ